MQVQPYLFFNGRCEEALAFYHEALGAEITMQMRYSENPDGCPEGMLPPGFENKIMHASMRVGDATVLASDGNQAGPTDFRGFSLSLDAADATQAEKLFNALSQDGKVQMPLGKTFFASSFGMVADRFGLSWMVIVMP